jgi:outer membrane protein insertion porin family
MKRLVPFLLLALLAAPVRAQDDPDPGDLDTDTDDAEAPAELPPTPEGSVAPAVPPGTGRAAPTIEKISFTGNRKVEDDALRVNLVSVAGAPLDPEKVRQDVRAIWKMGFFEDVRVLAERLPSGSINLVYNLTEKPSIRKILIQGNKEVDLDKINEVVDLKRNAVVDVNKVKKNTQKIRELYVGKGFYLASVDYEVRPVNEAEVDVWLKVDESAKVQIRRISFGGNETISSARLRSVMSTSEGGFLSFLGSGGTYQEEAFERDLALITAYYYDHGHVMVKVASPQITLSADKRFMYIHIPIDEGPIFQIGKLDFKGDLFGSKQEYNERLRTKPGDTFSRSRLGQDILKLNDFYKDKGFAYVNITPQTGVNMDKRLVDVTFEIEKGQKVYFERINVRGNSKTRDKVIRREMKISEGELYSQTNLDVSRARIQALGYFERVDVSSRRGSNDELIEVNIEIAEKPTGTFQIGAGFSSVENFIAQAQISQNNLFGWGQTLSLQAQLSGLRQLFSLRFIEPYFFDTRWTFAIDLYNQTTAQTTFARNAVGGSLTWGYPLSYESRAFLTYKLEEVGVSTGARGIVFSGGVASPTSPSSVANLFRGGVTSALRASLTYDTRDNRLFPTRGMFNNGFFEVADDFTGSENIFTRWGGFLRFYRPIWGPFVLKLNAEVGVVTSRLARGVPITERYIVGGINDVRGFRPRTLSPQVLVQSPGEPSELRPLPLGGNMQLIWNSEIEFPLFQRVGISGVVFFDAGNAYNLEEKWCSREASDALQLSRKVNPCFDFPESLTMGLRRSVGFGFRWFSPIGPLRFEWGIPLDRQPGEEPLVFEFTIGNFF